MENIKDLRLIVFGAFRYSLGRKTYMPSVVVDFIKNNQNIFHNEDWKIFIKEIDECDYLGMSCDIKTWNDFKDFCRSKL